MLESLWSKYNVSSLNTQFNKNSCLMLIETLLFYATAFIIFLPPRAPASPSRSRYVSPFLKLFFLSLLFRAFCHFVTSVDYFIMFLYIFFAYNVYKYIMQCLNNVCLEGFKRNKDIEHKCCKWYILPGFSISLYYLCSFFLEVRFFNGMKYFSLNYIIPWGIF